MQTHYFANLELRKYLTIVRILNSESDMGRAWAFSEVERVNIGCGASCVAVAQRLA